MAHVGIGLVGCGERAGGWTKRLLMLSDQLRLEAVCDTNPAAIKWGLDNLNSKASVYSDARQLARDSRVNWVLIGSPNHLHREHAVAALEAAKNVFCEKPLGTSVEECIAIRQAHRRAGTIFTVGFTLRYAPHYRKLASLVNRGAVGRILSMEFNETIAWNHGGFFMTHWRRLREQTGSFMLEKCCHDIDMANWLTGSFPVRVASFGGLNFFTPENAHQMNRLGKNADGKQAYLAFPATVDSAPNPFTSQKDIVDNQVVILEYANGTRATFHTNLNGAIIERRNYICGTEGSLRGDFLLGKIEVQRIGFDEPIIEHQSSEFQHEHGGGEDVMRADLLELMLNGGTPKAMLEDGLRSVVTCVAIDEAMETGKVVDLRPTWQGLEVA